MSIYVCSQIKNGQSFNENSFSFIICARIQTDQSFLFIYLYLKLAKENNNCAYLVITSDESIMYAKITN